MRYLVIALVLLFPIIAAGQHAHGPAKVEPVAVLAEGLGEVNLPVTTTNGEAQKFFNQGLAYMYAFNHEEAARSFKRATQLDPQLAMGYWGVSLALGSNYNVRADGPALVQAYSNLQKALELAPKASEHERAYIEALAKRYSADINADTDKLAANYRMAMRELVKRYPDDLDAATLYAESMMNLRPWKLWTKDGKPAEDTLEIVAVLENVLRRNPNHTGANHYYIHAVEASENAERALPSAARLGKIAPKAGHLVHMPSHIYIRTGDYKEAAQSNADAIVADREYIARAGSQNLYSMMYYNHNIHFLAAANAMKGRYADSIKSARELEANVSPHLKAMPMLEMFRPYSIVALTRFGKWDEVLKEPKPAPELKITTAFWHFSRGSAYAASKQVATAESELAQLQAVIKTVPADAPMGNNVAVNVLKVAELTLTGKIAYARGNKQVAFDNFRKAVEAEDATNYNEPQDWDLPVRESYGAMLLLSGDAVEAEKVFRAELQKHQRNGRALFGLSESLKRQNKNTAALMVKNEFDRAWENADVKLSLEDLAGVTASTSASNNDPSFSRIKLSTGLTLRYAERAQGDGPAIIMLHGYSDSWFSYSSVLPLLDAKYRVYILDQRGHGESERPPSGYRLQDFAADVVAFMDAKNIRRATIVGHSMGSFVGQHVAVRAPERVERLLLVGSATTAKNPVVLGLKKDITELSDPVARQFAHEFQWSTVFHPVPETFMQQVVDISSKMPARVWQGVLTGMLADDAEADLKKIKAPTLILWGDRETIFLKSEQEKLVAAIPHAQLKVYAETGHALHWERPSEFVRDLERFMSAVKAS